MWQRLLGSMDEAESAELAKVDEKDVEARELMWDSACRDALSSRLHGLTGLDATLGMNGSAASANGQLVANLENATLSDEMPSDPIEAQGVMVFKACMMSAPLRMEDTDILEVPRVFAGGGGGTRGDENSRLLQTAVANINSRDSEGGKQFGGGAAPSMSIGMLGSTAVRQTADLGGASIGSLSSNHSFAGGTGSTPSAGGFQSGGSGPFEVGLPSTFSTSFLLRAELIEEVTKPEWAEFLRSSREVEESKGILGRKTDE